MRAADVDRRLSESCRSWRRRRGNVTPGDRETVDTELKLPRTSTLRRWNHVRIPGKDRRHRLIRGTGSSRRPRFHRRRPQVARTRAKSPECRDAQHAEFFYRTRSSDRAGSWRVLGSVTTILAADKFLQLPVRTDFADVEIAVVIAPDSVWIATKLVRLVPRFTPLR